MSTDSCGTLCVSLIYIGAALKESRGSGGRTSIKISTAAVLLLLLCVVEEGRERVKREEEEEEDQSVSGPAELRKEHRRARDDNHDDAVDEEDARLGYDGGWSLLRQTATAAQDREGE